MKYIISIDYMEIYEVFNGYYLAKNMFTKLNIPLGTKNLEKAKIMTKEIINKKIKKYIQKRRNYSESS